MRIIQKALDVRARPCSLFLSFKLSLCRSQKTTHPLGVLDRGIGIVVVRLLAVGVGDKRIGVGSPLNLLELAAGTILCLFGDVGVAVILLAGARGGIQNAYEIAALWPRATCVEKAGWSQNEEPYV